jgi:hypothetical protein
VPKPYPIMYNPSQTRNKRLDVLGCVAGSLVVGIITSRLIEYPVLRLRDRLFPVAQIAHAPVDVAGTKSPEECPKNATQGDCQLQSENG